MAMTAILSASGVVAGKKAIENVVTDLYDGAKGAVKNKLKSWKNKQTLATLFKRISKVRHVKTIWQIDREIDLLDFYHPTSIIIEKKRKSVTTIDDFNYDGNVLIEGIVGQGKSIFLRFLCSQEIYLGKRIPVFLELRRLEADDLLETLIERMRILGFDVGKREFDYLARSGKVVLLLDAFDEVPEDAQSRLVTQIETLSEKYDALQIVITSRPDNQIVHSPHVRVYRLASIERQEVDSVITKLMGGSDVGKRLIKALQKDRGQVRGILTTPLMITLLVITYRAYGTLPSRLSEFYMELFTILISRHDKTKPGFVREKKCGLNDVHIREIFDGLCFLTRRDQASQVTDSQMLNYAKDAISLSGRTCDEAAFIDDIRQVTNLILKEANKYYFIHKSVQEFHCASYISGLKDDKQAARFYRRVRRKWWNWREELNFLGDIDEFKFAKWFLIKDIDSFLSRYVGRVPKTWKRTPSSVVLRLLSDFSVVFSCNDKGEVGICYVLPSARLEIQSWCMFGDSAAFYKFIHSMYMGVDENALRRSIETPHACKLNRKDRRARWLFAPGERPYTIRGDNAFLYEGLKHEESTSALHRFLNDILAKRRAAERLIAAHEKRLALMDV